MQIFSALQYRGSQPRVLLLPRRHLTISTDICDCYKEEAGDTGI